MKFKIIALFSILLSYSGYSQQYAIVNHIKLTGDEGWDYLYLDEPSSLLYISHGSKVQVVDTKTSREVAEIANLKGVHGIALASTLHKGYISCGKDSTVVVFDLNSYNILSRIKVKGANPDAIIYEPFFRKVWVFNGKSDNCNVIDPATDAIVGEVPLAGKPEFAVSNLMGSIYVNIEDKSTLCELNVTTMLVTHSWPVAPADEPSGLAIDTKNKRLYSVADHHLVVIDATSGRVVAARPIGDRVDGVVYDADVERAYTANGDGTITVVGRKGDGYQVLETIPTVKGARTIALDPKSHHLYLPCAAYSSAPVEGSKRPAILPGTFEILEIAPNGKR